jgi:probable O-glycosylation ligase (exosortase A-associated)
MFLQVKRKLLFGALAALAVLGSIPFLPASFTSRMDTISNYQGDESASTRLAVWQWTIDYANRHPLGGGFDAYRQNSFRYQTVSKTVAPNGDVSVEHMIVVDKARAYHSSYFEMLGEQGYVGLTLWLILHLGTVIQTGRVRRRYRNTTDPDKQWIAPYAQALSQGHIIYLIGCFFVGIAFQPFVFMLIALQIALTTYLRRIEQVERWQPILPGLAPQTAAGN